MQWRRSFRVIVSHRARGQRATSCGACGFRAGTCIGAATNNWTGITSLGEFVVALVAISDDCKRSAVRSGETDRKDCRGSCMPRIQCTLDLRHSATVFRRPPMAIGHWRWHRCFFQQRARQYEQSCAISSRRPPYMSSDSFENLDWPISPPCIGEESYVQRARPSHP
jgi:hypothetical protein